MGTQPGAKRILLVDDNEHDIELALTAFEHGDLGDSAPEVEVVRSGEEALRFLRAAPRRPAVVLLDVKMPHMDGLGVLREMKADPGLRDIPVVMLTTSREDADVRACYALGASAYVVKPVDFTRFLEVVRTIGAFWALLNEAPPATRS